ncbi:MAG: chorismate mutase [Treponema sp.]|nr:chorismate mutase [Treponema sp.]
MDLEELRREIDRIDDKLVELFEKRMDVSSTIAGFKKERNIPLHDPEREKEKLKKLSGKVQKGYESYIKSLYSLLFEISRTEQAKIIND